MAAHQELTLGKTKKTIFSTKRDRAVTFNTKNFWTTSSNIFQVTKCLPDKKIPVETVKKQSSIRNITTTKRIFTSKLLENNSSKDRLDKPRETKTRKVDVSYERKTRKQDEVPSSQKSTDSSTKNRVLQTYGRKRQENQIRVEIKEEPDVGVEAEEILPDLDSDDDKQINDNHDQIDLNDDDEQKHLLEDTIEETNDKKRNNHDNINKKYDIIEIKTQKQDEEIVIESDSPSSASNAELPIATIMPTADNQAKISMIKPKKFFSSKRTNNERTKSYQITATFWDHQVDFMEDQQSQSQQQSSSSQTAKNDLNTEFDSEGYYVVKRVKKANQCHDLGETEQFDGDIKFYLDGIESKNGNPLRCLSILGLAQQTLRPEFRLHLRAHDDMPKIISALKDAPKDPNLALCTATLLFIYHQGGRLTMDINANALSLMLQLMEARIDERNQVEPKHRNKVRQLCEEVKKNGHGQYLNLDEITAGKLSMETLLCLTSKRANKDSLKDEMRKLKGIDFILDTVLRCNNYDEDGQMIIIDRCMHVLENCTLDNIENQLYLMNYEDGNFVDKIIRLLNFCKERIIILSEHKVVLSTFFSLLRVLTHLTSENVNGCQIIGSHEGIIDLLICSIIELPIFILPDQRFDLMIILLCLCINLLEFCPNTRSLVINNKTLLKKLIQLLMQRIEEAQRTEQSADELLESHEKIQMTEQIRDSILTQILEKSGKHMEHSIIAGCVSLLFGCAIQDSYEFTRTLKDQIPDSSFNKLIEVLQKLRDFAHLADIMTTKGKERVERIIQVFKNNNK